MGTRLVAKWPDGTESRVAWALWMLAGLVLGVQVAQSTIFIGAAQHIARSMGDSTTALAIVILAGGLNALLVFGVLILVVPFAQRRLLMPEHVWAAFAIPPVLLALNELRPPVDAAFVFASALVPAAIYAAWWRTRRRSAVSESAVDTSAA